MATARGEEAAAAGAVISKLEADLMAARAALRTADEERAELERNMRQAFMRATCTLNLESMSVLKRPTGSAGEAETGEAAKAGALGGAAPHPQ